MNFKPLPIVGETYIYVDDGKLRRSRLYDVIINGIYTKDEIDNETKNAWIEDVDNCKWIYAKDTDVFIKASLNLFKSFEEIVFVRTKDGGFFSLGFWGGRLDVDGSMLKELEEYENQE